MHIIEKSSEVRLFLVGQSGAPFEGTDGELAYPSLPLYALLRVGEITTQPGNEYVLGIQRSSRLKPTCDTQLPFIPESYEDTISKFADNTCIQKVFYCLQRSSVGFSVSETEDKKDIKRTTVLLPFESLKNVRFHTREGFGVFLGLEDLKRLVEKQRGETFRQAESLKTLEVIKLTMPAVSVSALGLNIAFEADLDDLSFLTRAMERWDKRSREERREKWKKYQRVVIGTST